jgi:hypothetical protein
MTNEAIIKECLFQYVQLILRFETALKKIYNLKDNPYRCQHFFPRAGKLETMADLFTYRFHGAGCSFEHNNVEVHYDYHIIEDNYLTTVSWKFWRFVVTYSNLKGWANLTNDEVDHELEALTSTKAIQRLYPHNLVYQINFSWVESFRRVA